jgi:phosphoribosylaminoimidazole-succinocarboxamide synthase
MGSVKDLVVLEEPSGSRCGRGRFVFSDRYSVFDWGEMPDHIPEKGKAICVVAAYFLERLEEMGVKTHYLGLVEGEEVKRLGELQSPSGIMEIELVRVLEPPVADGRYDYSVFGKERVNILIPLEVMYRNSLPAGCSVFKRLQEGSLKLEDLGLDRVPEPGQALEKTMLDFSTKLESSDRYLGQQEAMAIAGLDQGELEDIKRVTLLADDLISGEAERLGLANEDGKVEFAFDGDRNLMLVDALGTLDECRFTHRGLPVSKEIARVYYRNTDWYQDTESAKAKDKVNWKELVTSSPPPLPEELLRNISYLYMAYANEITGREFFEAPSLRQSLQAITDILDAAGA